jgi:hypothetical protein
MTESFARDYTKSVFGTITSIVDLGFGCLSRFIVVRRSV